MKKVAGRTVRRRARREIGDDLIGHGPVRAHGRACRCREPDCLSRPGTPFADAFTLARRVRRHAGWPTGGMPRTTAAGAMQGCNEDSDP